MTRSEPDLRSPASDPDTAPTRRRIGDLDVHPIGFGGMRLSIEGRPDRERAIAAVRAALDSGAELFDTADAYHAFADDEGHNELLLADALRAAGGPSVLIATKGGKVRPGDGRWLIDARPEHLARAARASARRLGVDAIALYQLHAPDPAVPFRESLDALAQLVDDGVAVRLGVSNVSPEQLREAHGVLGPHLVAVQNELSPTSGGSNEVLAAAERLGLAFLAWRPLGAVLARAGAGGFATVSAARGVSVAQVVLAWHLARSPVLVPIPGSTRPQTARDSTRAAVLELTPEEMDLLNRTPE